MSALLEVKGLKVDFRLEDKVINAVENASFYLNEREVLVLAGESGSGKTVCALSLTRLLPENARIVSGSVIFNNVDLLRASEDSLVDIRGKEIAYIFQEPVSYLNPVLSIREQIMETIMLHQHLSRDKAQAEALRLLELVKIRDARRVLLDYPHQLSGGMNQRVFLAMALACRPKLLIADEPTTSLDVTVEAQMLSLLMELKKELNFSLLFITHNLSIARRIADRICVMYKGKIVEEGKRDAVFSQPQHFHTKELIKAYELIGKL